MSDINVKRDFEVVGWVRMSQVGMLKNVPFGLYAISAPENTIPSKKIWPHEYENTCYFGIAGSSYDGAFYDRKSIEHERYWITTPLQKRLNEHRSQLIRSNLLTERESSYIKFYEKYGYGTDVIERTNVCVMTPKRRIEDKRVRSWLQMAESLLIWQYAENFGKEPFMNIAHTQEMSYSSLNNSESLNQIKKKSIEENSILRFING